MEENTVITEYTNYSGEYPSHFPIAVYDLIGYQETALPITIPEPM